MSDFYSAGSASVANGGVVVTGTGTVWKTWGLMAGDTFNRAGVGVPIASVDSDTQLTLAYGWPGATVASASHIVLYTAPRRSGADIMVKVRELLAKLDLIGSGVAYYSVQSVGSNAPPSTPATGDQYVVGTAPTGAWAGQARNIAGWTGTSWQFTAPTGGWHAYSRATNQQFAFVAGAWQLTDGVASVAGLTGTVTAAQIEAAEKVARGGYNYVQSGTGPSQLANQVKIGWDGTRLRFAVDGGDLGSFVENGTGPSQLPGNKVQVGWNGANVRFAVDGVDIGTYVQNGTGPSQIAGQLVKVGYDGSAVRFAVGTTDLGAVKRLDGRVIGTGFLDSTYGGSLRLNMSNTLSLHWSGSGFYYNIDGNSWVLINSSPSDSRLKQDIEPLTGALSLLSQIQPKTFEFRDGLPVSHTAGRHPGLIAQDVAAVLPSAIEESDLPPAPPDPDGPEMPEEPAFAGAYLRYAADADKQLIALLIGAVQELAARVEALEAA